MYRITQLFLTLVTLYAPGDGSLRTNAVVGQEPDDITNRKKQ